MARRPDYGNYCRDPFDLTLSPFTRYHTTRKPLPEHFKVKENWYIRSPQTIYRSSIDKPGKLYDLPPDQLVDPEKEEDKFSAPVIKLPSAPPGPGISTDLGKRWHKASGFQHDPFNLHYKPYDYYACVRTPLDDHWALRPQQTGEPTHKPLYQLTSVRNPMDCYLWATEKVEPQESAPYKLCQLISLSRPNRDTLFYWNNYGINEVWPPVAFQGLL